MSEQSWFSKNCTQQFQLRRTIALIDIKTKKNENLKTALFARFLPKLALHDYAKVSRLRSSDGMVCMAQHCWWSSYMDRELLVIWHVRLGGGGAENNMHRTKHGGVQTEKLQILILSFSIFFFKKATCPRNSNTNNPLSFYIFLVTLRSHENSTNRKMWSYIKL